MNGKLPLGAIIGLVIGLAGAGLGIYAAMNPKGGQVIENFMNSPQTIQWLPYVVAILVIGPLILGFGPFVKNIMKNSQKKKRLMQVGQKAKAKILDVRDTGVTVNMNPYVEITVEINGAKAKFTMLMSRVTVVRPGDEIEVLYDPADPTVVMPVTS